MPFVDVEFRLLGAEIPVDHGYHLLSSVSEIVPFVHGNQQIGIHPIRGDLVGNRLQRLNRKSRLIVRLPSEKVRDILPVAGKSLELGGKVVHVGVPNTSVLRPAESLWSRLVVIKGFMEPASFLEAVERQLHENKIDGQPELIEQSEVPKANANRKGGSRSPYVRRTIRIRDKEIVGFAVRINGLSAEDSIRVQELGVGGRRRFGCGVFVPVASQ